MKQAEINVTSNRKHEAWLNLPILTMRPLLTKILGSLTDSVIAQLVQNPLETFRSNVCGTGSMTSKDFPICPLYAGGICKGPDNKGKARIQLMRFKYDKAHCVDGLNIGDLAVAQEAAQQANNRRAGF